MTGACDGSQKVSGSGGSVFHFRSNYFGDNLEYFQTLIGESGAEVGRRSVSVSGKKGYSRLLEVTGRSRRPVNRFGCPAAFLMPTLRERAIQHSFAR